MTTTTTTTLWALVPNLTVIRETPKALLFQQEENESPVWIPKSQVNFELWAESRCFVAIAAWIVRQRGLDWWTIAYGAAITIPWLREKEKQYEECTRDAVLLPSQPQRMEREEPVKNSQGIPLFWQFLGDERTAAKPQQRQGSAAGPKRGRAMNLGGEEE